MCFWTEWSDVIGSELLYIPHSPSHGAYRTTHYSVSHIFPTLWIATIKYWSTHLTFSLVIPSLNLHYISDGSRISHRGRHEP